MKIRFTAIFSCALGAAIVLVWLVVGWITGALPRVEHHIFSYGFSHSRLWDGLLGLQAVIFLRARELEEYDESEDRVGEIPLFIMFALFGFFQCLLFALWGHDAGSGLTLGSIAALATPVTVLSLAALNQIRQSAMYLAGYAFGLSLFSGALLGAIMTAGLAVIFAAVLLVSEFLSYRFGRGFPL